MVSTLPPRLEYQTAPVQLTPPYGIPSTCKSDFVLSGIKVVASFSDVKSGFTTETDLDSGTDTPWTLQIDTGSSGIVIPMAALGSSATHDKLKAKYPCLGAGSINYFPSTNSHNGIWYQLPVNFAATDSAGHAVTIATNALVLVCDNVTSHDQYGMMGIAAKGDDPAYNALLNASVIDSNNVKTALNAAYCLKQDGVYLGVAHTAGDNFVGTDLLPATPPPLPAVTNGKTLATSSASTWTNPPAAIRISPPSGSILNSHAFYTLSFELDTGINQALLCMPMGMIYMPENLHPTFGNYLPTESLGHYDAGSFQWYFADGTTIEVCFPPNNAVVNMSWKIDNSATTARINGSAPTSWTNNEPYGYTLYMGPTNFNPAPDATGTTTAGNTDAAASAKGLNAPSDRSYQRINVGRIPLMFADYLYDADVGFIGFYDLKS